MKIIRLNYFLLFLVLIPILFLSNEIQINPINNQGKKETLSKASNEFSINSLKSAQFFSLIETSENYNSKKNVSSIDINLDTSRWNISNLKVNVTNMYFQKEIKTVVDKPELPFTIEKNFPRLGVQLRINNPTILDGVYIYGQNYSSIPSNIYVQIRGSYQNGTPDESKRYGNPLLLNMSVSKGLTWHKQTFSSPISLSKGIYYLIINGTSIGLTPPTQIKFSWWYINFDPVNPTLNTSRYERTLGWSADYRYTGSPLLYKLIQRINATYYPTQINLTAKINGIVRYFNNGKNSGSGNLSIPFNNFFPNTSLLNIPVKNNLSEALIFNLSYYVKLNNSLICSGSVLIKDGFDNIWTIEPKLERFGWNYFIMYKYPKSWRNFTVYKDNDKLSGNNYTINESQKILTILNNTIPNLPSIPWKIIANSSNLDISLYFPETSFNSGENFGYFVSYPVKLGNYTFVLIDRLGLKEQQELKIILSQTTFPFNYTIPSYAISGEWVVFTFWNNNTDAGVKVNTILVSGSQSLPSNVILPSASDNGGKSKTELTGLDPFIVYITILILGIIAASSFTSYKTLKRVKKVRDLRRKKLSDKITNVLSLTNVIVIDKNSGLNVYEEFYGGRSVDTTLVSGFLDAIRSFGIELTNARTQSQTISLEYQDSKILMAEFKNFRLIFIMGEKPSEEFLKSITNLSYDIDTNFGEELGKFKGDIVQFRGIRSLIENQLDIGFISPLKVVEALDVETKPSERKIISKAKKIMKEYKPSEKAMILKAKNFMKENNLNYFFASFLLEEQNLNPKDVKTIYKLLEKKIFQPLEIPSNVK